MATSLTVSSGYAGKEAGSIIGASFKEADTLRLNLLTVAENVGFKLNMRRIRYTDGTTAYSCGDFTPSGAITLDERVLTPSKMMNPFQVCKETFRQTWSSDAMGASASNLMPNDIQDAILAEVLASQAQKIDADIWSGDDANDGEFDGFIKLFTADASVIKANNGIVPSGNAITEATVIAELKLALNAVPTRIRRKDLQVAVSPDVFQAYWFAQVSNSISNDGNGEAKQVRFGRYTLTEVNGLPDNTIIVFETENLVFGTALESDFNSIDVRDEDEIGLLTGQVRGKMVYSAGVNYYNSEDVVYYLSTTTPA
jgi:hypothetical protein